MRTQLKPMLKSYLRTMRRWVSKSELETIAKRHGFLAYTADRRLQEMTATSGNLKMVDPTINKKEIKGQVHYRII